MKALITIALLAVVTPSCTDTYSDPSHTAVVAYLKGNLNDPASYEGKRWGAEQSFSRRDSAAFAAEKLSSEYDKTKAPEAIKQAIKLEAITDTTRVGTRLTHAYRAKNKLGATVLDSAQFVVYKNGKVEQL